MGTKGTNISFAKVKAYLDGIANNPNNVGDINNSPHKFFWQVDYQTFTTGTIPSDQGPLLCNNKPIPIIDKTDPTQSGFYIILTNPNGYCNIAGGQMPESGPYITDPGYQVTLADGSVVSGEEIKKDLFGWLNNGYPENGDY